MSIAEQLDTAVPAGTWEADSVHSRVSFAVRHMGVAEFHGSFRGIRAVLDAEGLRGSVAIADIGLDDDPSQEAHVLSPDFFDAERFPEATFVSTSVERTGDELAVEGELTVKGAARPVSLTGTIAGPTADPYGNERIGVILRTTVDRRDFGVDWNAPLPGGGDAIDWQVALTANIQLVRKDA
jgi:polyisoprenoid-binding protein YceI